MDLKKYINRLEKESQRLDSNSSKINKNFYLDIIEKVVEGYGYDCFENMATGKEPFVICIGFRVVGAISYLLMNKRKLDWFDMWIRLMDISCDQLFLKPDTGEKDLAVKELMIAMKNMKNIVDENHYTIWFEKLKSIDPYLTYSFIIDEDKNISKITNITVYNLTGEYLRESEGMLDTTKYFDKHWPKILKMFDENGMFVDFDHAMLYDLTTRCQISVMLWYDYNGKYKEELDRNLEKAGMMTLLMQSSAYQLPFGGRSNQYLFNEALVASNCEYEALRHYKKGNIVRAGMYKRCAHMSALTVLRWLDSMYPPKHNKNLFSHDRRFGTDGYGTFPRYLITLANFIGYGFLFADDSIEEYTCPSEIGGYAFEISKKLHKVFANCCDNSIEIELAADLEYDSTGMGRYHKTKIPIELGLSMPFAAKSKYYLPDELERRDISICTGWKTPDGSVAYISDFKDKLKTKVNIIEQSPEKVIFSVEYSGDVITGCSKIIEEFTLDKEGVLIETELIDALNMEIFFTVPLFMQNGRDTSNIKYKNRENTRDNASEDDVTVIMGDNYYNVSSDGEFREDKYLYGNRNGIYKLATIYKCDNKLTVKLNLCKNGE